ncbi:probable serine/threonine protein kinase related protein [Lentisphaera araneosa HTCC2155]|uniref:Probable serine/threonine protein kinase related protein n=2 Tax=Lentisphaera TaxID=256846 RepID=A6DP42_9BACT|nr:probable serine/threonine protein kinase related protein [Lentisphaera araneosa HTCC2155]
MYMKFLLLLLPSVLIAQNWSSAMGPNSNYQVEGDAPIKWSLVRNENIKWRRALAEAGQSAVIVWGDKLFTTMHKAIESEDQKMAVKDVIALCLDGKTGEILWQKELPGLVTIQLSSGFSDGTVFSPLCDGEKVWFFNRCGQMACFDLDGKEIWRRSFKPRYMHTNRQAEPRIEGDAILYVEMANKKEEYTSLGKKDLKKKKEFSQNREFWTYIHGIDKNTGEILWRDKHGITVHSNPLVNTLKNGERALVEVRGGPHAPVEGPAGLTLMSLEKGREGEAIWTKDFAHFVQTNLHWNSEFIPLFAGEYHYTLNTKDGSIFKKVNFLKNVILHKSDEPSKETDLQSKKNKPATYSTNILVGDDHYFLAHASAHLGKINVRTGSVEYLELPAQVIPGKNSRSEDQFKNSIKEVKNIPINQKGFAVGHKGHNTAGFGHMQSASPILVGKHLIFPVVTGTVYVIDTTKTLEKGKALVAINDLGEAGRTWTLSSFTYSQGKLFARTMKEIICIENKEEVNAKK